MVVIVPPGAEKQLAARPHLAPALRAPYLDGDPDGESKRAKALCLCFQLASGQSSVSIYCLRAVP